MEGPVDDVYRLHITYRGDQVMQRIVTVILVLHEQTLEEAMSAAQKEQDEDSIEWIEQNRASFPLVTNVDSVTIVGEPALLRDPDNQVEESYFIHKARNENELNVHIAAFYE
jgi:hypothetical protein